MRIKAGVRFVLFLAVLLSGAHVFAQSSVWQVRKGANTLYLGGSIHMLRASDFPLPREFDLAFEKSSVLVLESDMAELESPDSMLPYLMLPVGKTLRTELDPKTFQELEKTCGELGLPLENFMQMTPGAMFAVLVVAQLQGAGFTSPGVDEHYQERARKEGKKLLFLETPTEQLALVNELGEDLLRQSLKDPTSEVVKIMTQLVTEWRSGVQTTNEALVEEMRRDYPHIYQRLLLDRNQAWLQKIDGYLESAETEFLLVGFMHLALDDGLLQSLRNKGYEVRQLR
ncbi:MAG: TraB/GumN family protein [Zoogloeaceae bacterium]|nr:TraB/GumN family protein [Zoogloeaceae bacterium]